MAGEGNVGDGSTVDGGGSGTVDGGDDVQG